MGATNQLLPAGRFFGTTALSTAVAGFQLSELVYPPSVVLPYHAHTHANFCFVLQGHYEEVCERKSCLHTTSHLVFHPAGHGHSDRHAPTPVRLLSVELGPERLAQVSRHPHVLNSTCSMAGGAAAGLCLRLRRELRQSDDVSVLAMEGLVLEILASLARGKRRAGKPSPPGWVRQADELLRTRCLGTVRLAQLASEVGVHPVHFARTFRSVYRCGPAEYIRRLRVEAASRHIQNPKRSLGEIAHLTGFSDQSHLTRTFRQLIGMTPGEFRRQFSR